MSAHPSDGPARHRGFTSNRPMLSRTRLLALMAARLDRSVTVISAGAGFGKSTLLAQTIADPLTADRVHYVVHRVGPTDPNGEAMAAALADQLAAIAGTLVAVPVDDPAASTTGISPGTTASDVSLADQIWHLSPAYVTIVVDDIHLLGAGSAGWSLLDDLIHDLPENGDAVLSGRGFHELTLARLLTRGEAVEIDESMLAFTADEIDEFARLRSVDRTALDDHGWPALIELEARAGVAGAHAFVAEEVLDALEPRRLDALRRIALHDHIDDALVRATTSFPGSADALLADLPLTSRNTDGGWTLHDLWKSVPVAGHDTDARTESLTAGAQLLRERGAVRDAIALAVEAGDNDITLDLLADFARDLPLANSIGARRFVLELLPHSLSGTAEAELLRADIVFASEPMRAAGPLQHAIDAATAQDRPEVTVLALLRLGDMAYRSGDRAGLRDSHERLGRLDALGGTGAAAALVLTESWLLLLDNDPTSAIALMGSEALRSYPPVGSMADYYRAVQLGHAGQAEASLRALEHLASMPDARILERRGGFAALMRWWTGSLDADGRLAADRLLDRVDGDHQQHFFVEGAATSALWHAGAGDVATAQALLARARAQRDRVPAGSWAAISVETAGAVVELVGGDEAAAARRLEGVLPDTGPFDGFARHVFGNVGALLYVLVPRSRPFFDEERPGPDLAVATDVGRAIVALREHGSASLASRLPWQDISRLRTWAYEPHLAELAIAAMSNGVIQAGTALAGLRIDPRRTLRGVAERHAGTVATLAREELDRTPTRPSLTTHVRVLGPTAVSVGSEPGSDAPPIRRKMVRELLLLLVHRGRLRRDEIAALMWPDRDETSARNNLRATLNHLRTLLEHSVDDADAGPPWHVRSDGESLELFASDRLVIDAVAFEQSVRSARRADAERRPADALAHCRHAIARYRGPYLHDALDQDWAFNHRMTLHLDHVEMCIRASELLDARGDVGEALALARTAVDAEPLSERAHRALVRALLTSEDRPGARRAHARCLELLGADGLSASADTIRLGAGL
ncbi:MAG: BTAD domain-containing putative transcriptional regulator [Ilumatobacter sp.]